MWQLKKKIGTQKYEVPAAKKNKKGELITEQSKLKNLYEETYKQRLEHRKMKPELINMYKMKMELFELRNEVTKNIKSKNWTEDDLVQVLKKLKKNKSTDSQGLIYELFLPKILGQDLFKSLLMLCNVISLLFQNF